MEPMDDRELNQLLRQWEAPGAPAAPAPAGASAREPWWRWFVTGTIRIPVPVGWRLPPCLATVWMYSSEPPREPVVRRRRGLTSLWFRSPTFSRWKKWNFVLLET